jgi:glycine cleavage system H protein
MPRCGILPLFRLIPLEHPMAAPRRYAPSHEWIRLEDDGTATIGISAYAVEALTDLVFMQLPEVGRHVKAGESFGEIESVKAVSDMYAPVSGDVVAVNTELPQRLETLGQDPYEAGWIVRIKPDTPADVEGLLDQAAYDALVAKQSH